MNFIEAFLNQMTGREEFRNTENILKLRDNKRYSKFTKTLVL